LVPLSGAGHQEKEEQMSYQVVCIFPHAGNEFLDSVALKDWLVNDLVQAQGRYLLRKIGYKDKDFITRVVPGSLVLFRKGDLIVGEGTAETNIRKLEPPENNMTVLGKSQTYYYEIYISPDSIRTYELPITKVEKWCKRELSRQFYLIIGDRASFENELKAYIKEAESMERNANVGNGELSQEVRTILGNIDEIEIDIFEHPTILGTGESIIAKGFSSNSGIRDMVNVIPGGDPGSCHDTLVVAIGSNTSENVEARILEAMLHIGIKCRNTHSVIFLAAKWETQAWIKHAKSFRKVTTILRIFGASETILE
jgi:hypothetical protein